MVFSDGSELIIVTFRFIPGKNDSDAYLLALLMRFLTEKELYNEPNLDLVDIRQAIVPHIRAVYGLLPAIIFPFFFPGFLAHNSYCLDYGAGF